MYVCVYVCVYECMYACVYVCVQGREYYELIDEASVCVCVYAYGEYACVYVSMYECMWLVCARVYEGGWVVFLSL